MRTLLAFAFVVGGVLALSSTDADAQRRYKRSAERYYYYVPRREAECARARHADPSGQFARYPCWAREAFGPRGGRGRR
jgi:hypothetical protein